MTPRDAVDPRHDEDRDGGPEVARPTNRREHHHARKVQDSSVRSSPPTWVPARIRIKGPRGERHIEGIARWPFAIHPAPDGTRWSHGWIPWVITHQPSGHRLASIGFLTPASARIFADELIENAPAPGFGIKNPAAHLELAVVLAEALHARGYEATITAHTSPGASA